MDSCNSSSSSEDEDHRVPIIKMQNDSKNVPKYWSVYFTDDVSDGVLMWVNVTSAIREFFRSNSHNFEDIFENDLLVIWLDIEKIKDIRVPLPDPLKDLSNLLRERPLETVNCIALAIHQLLGESGKIPKGSRVYPRLINFNSSIPIRRLKSNFVEKFVVVKGTVLRTSPVKPLVIGMFFDCPRCGNRMFKKFIDGRYEPIAFCSETKCKNRNLIPDRTSTNTIDWQKIKIQEIIGEDDSDLGRIPRTIEVELSNDLVDTCLPGDIVTIAGILKAVKNEFQTGVVSGKDKNQCLFVLYIDANSVVSGKNDSESSDQLHITQNKLSCLDFSLRDLHAIRAIHSCDNIFRLIVNSLCPAIFGHELVKAGLCLALFGGVRKQIDETGQISVRGDPHLLIVGDPGLGKSQMLKATANISPRGIYVCGNTTTTSGLTVTMTRDGSGGDYSLEAGALVLADQGSCCIDEFDKMAADHQSLLEAMEQQSISIAKGGVVCSLRARTSVIAAANPIGGHYDHSKTVNENLRISAALLSRFDLIFILLDKPDAERDQVLSEHVMSIHGRAGHSFSMKNNMKSITVGDKGWNDELPLSEKLKLSESEREEFDPIPPYLLRKYIIYAKEYVFPILSEEAKAVLKDFYLELRKNYQTAEATPITTRQLESMVRLAEAKAKSELREIVTEQDAKDVVEIMKESLCEIFSDERGNLDFSRSKGMSKSKQTKSFIKFLDTESKNSGRSIFTMQELYNFASQINFKVDNFREFVEILNHQGVLLKKPNNRYQLITGI